MNTIDTINRLGALVDEPPVALEYIDTRVQMPNPRAYTAQEIAWQREAAELEAVVKCGEALTTKEPQ